MIVPLYTYEWYNSQDELHQGGKQNREVWVGERKSVVKLRIFKWRCCWCFKRFIAYEQDYLCEFCKTFWRRREPPALEEKSFSTNSHKWTHTQAKNIQIHIGLFLPGQIPLFISTLSIAISPVNEFPTIPSNITCEKELSFSQQYTCHFLYAYWRNKPSLHFSFPSHHLTTAISLVYG